MHPPTADDEPGSYDFYVRLGRRIADLRRALDLSQERLGERAGVGTSHVSHIEVGTRRPTLEVLRRLATALAVPLWRLITDDRHTRDERTWDAASRALADQVRGLGPDDLRALAYLAARLRGSNEAPGLGQAKPPRATLRAAESEASRPRQRGPRSRR